MAIALNRRPDSLEPVMPTPSSSAPPLPWRRRLPFVGLVVALLMSMSMITAPSAQAAETGWDFTVTAAFAGESAAEVPAGTAITLGIEFTLADGTETTVTETLTDGETYTSPALLPGSSLSISTTLPDVPGISWDGAPWSLAGSPLGQDGSLAFGAPDSASATFPFEVSPTALAAAEPAPVAMTTFSLAAAMAQPEPELGTGDGAPWVPAGTAFEVLYLWETADDSGVGYLDITAGGSPTTSAELPVGAKVTFSSSTLPDVANIRWGDFDPAFTPAEITVTDDPAANTATAVYTPTVAKARFTVTTAVTGEAADLVTAAAPEIAVVYSYGSLAGQGTGSLAVPLEGRNRADELPVTTEVTFTDVTLPTIDGVTWGEITVEPWGGEPTALSEGPTLTITASGLRAAIGPSPIRPNDVTLTVEAIPAAAPEPEPSPTTDPEPEPTDEPAVPEPSPEDEPAPEPAPAAPTTEPAPISPEPVAAPAEPSPTIVPVSAPAPAAAATSATLPATGATFGLGLAGVATAVLVAGAATIALGRRGRA
ncbi:MAG: DUF5979 domain-containing protein [Propionibacteriaceae bacterium]|jgi:hypothetical protein|nr:DUF5979 domain-containing protein [Propionibacteriaceae bacterium]